jgi:hypothetical protein
VREQMHGEKKIEFGQKIKKKLRKDTVRRLNLMFKA